MTLDTLTTVFGWMAVINIVYLSFATLAMFAMQDLMVGIHQKIFGMPEADLRKSYFDWLGTYKTLTMVLTIVPYFALKLV